MNDLKSAAKIFIGNNIVNLTAYVLLIGLFSAAAIYLYRESNSLSEISGILFFIAFLTYVMFITFFEKTVLVVYPRWVVGYKIMLMLIFVSVLIYLTVIKQPSESMWTWVGIPVIALLIWRKKLGEPEELNPAKNAKKQLLIFIGAIVVGLVVGYLFAKYYC